MAYLSKNKFYLNSSEVRVPEEAISLYNKCSFERNKFKEIYFKHKLKTQFENFFEANNISVNDVIEKGDKIFIGNGSIIKAEIFNDHDKFMPLSISFLISFLDCQQIINNELINKIHYFFLAKNISRYYLINYDELLTFLKDHINTYIYLTYC